jgi:hypothetical protein
MVRAVSWGFDDRLGLLTRYASGGRTAEAKKPIAPMNEKMAE